MGAQHEAIDKHMKHFLELEFHGGSKSSQGEELHTVAEQEIQEMVTLHFQLVADGESKNDTGAANSEQPGALVASSSNAISIFGGSRAVDNSELKAEVARVKEWLDNDPRRKRLQVSFHRCF